MLGNRFTLWDSLYPTKPGSASISANEILSVDFGYIGNKYHISFESLSFSVYHSLVKEVLSPVVTTPEDALSN